MEKIVHMPCPSPLYVPEPLSKHNQEVFRNCLGDHNRAEILIRSQLTLPVLLETCPGRAWADTAHIRGWAYKKDVNELRGTQKALCVARSCPMTRSWRSVWNSLEKPAKYSDFWALWHAFVLSMVLLNGDFKLFHRLPE